MAAVGKAFGLSLLQATRAGLLLAAGGEFAFVTFGEAVSHKILPAALVSKLFLIVSLSMALTPFLAEGGARLGKMFEKSDVKASQLFIYACCISPSSEQSLLVGLHNVQDSMSVQENLHGSLSPSSVSPYVMAGTTQIMQV